MRFFGLFALPVLLLTPAFGADIAGTWAVVWTTPGGERRSEMTFIVDGETVKLQIPAAEVKVTGSFKQDTLKLAGTIYSKEVGREGQFKLEGRLSGDELKGNAAWEDSELTFVATRSK